ncbi:MAG: DUF1998 domain-containing protein, partial [Phycisphaerales bacterium]|nr:DUF1998 domain-containing protein [Phycisphaerales bacterium]
LHFCRACGAAHPGPFGRCLGCGREGPSVELYAIRGKADNPGRLTSCLCCGSTARTLGTRYREPARPVRATNVSDVHVLAQDMIHHAERRRLLVFADNRQDAAFQAGWMSDHARRFRLRALMYEQLQGDTLSVGDLTSRLCAVLDADDTLSRALIPEVWKVQRKEGGGGQHAEERKIFLRLQILREVTTSPRQALGLEPWGRLKVSYTTLSPSSGFIQTKSAELGIPAEDLCEGIAAILDYLRRNRVLYDHDTRVFSTLFQDGHEWIQSGYIPQFHSPVGTKFRREPSDKGTYSKQWVSEGGGTVMRQIARKWGCPDGAKFLESLWEYLRAEGSRILIPAELKGHRGTNLSGSSGLYQVDVDQIRLSCNHGAYRCRTCRRRSPRRTPHLKCLAWQCSGELEYQREDPEDYNLQLLDGRYDMIRPAEHTAMVPNSTRERLEIEFKGDSERVNCLVCTQTLEMGVDIGALDAILMRNVPPLPANYWQRAGRAGRRHRMAVDLTYCRPTSHDRAYFAEPLKMLEGRVDPPSFNLRNELLVAKHVHATVLTRLHQLARPGGPLGPDEAERIADTLKEVIPTEIKGWLFNADGTVRDDAFDVSALGRLIQRHIHDLETHVRAVFRQGWPEADADVTRDSELHRLILALSDELQGIVARLRRRLRWAQTQLKRLHEVEQRLGALSKEDEYQRRRCSEMIRRMKGDARRRTSEAEGYDDTYTFGVLAAEGFLPGYGLESGSIMATAEMPFGSDGPRELFLPRPPSVALREYVPGNLIYSNGQRFVARIFRQSAEEGRSEVINFEVSSEREAVKESTGPAMGGLGSSMLPAISVCDVDLVHRSHISDEEDTRFQLGVATYGHELDQHGGGQAYKWGGHAFHHRRAVRMRLVNAGATAAMNRATPILGYPLCLVCGQSRSPLSSDAELDRFRSEHKERCGRSVQSVGFYSDVIADAITLPRCNDRTQAYSVLEALRMAAASILDMHIEDLQVLVIGHVDRDTVDGVLWDPMPGGSGLLDQLCQRFEEVVQAAARIIDLCPQSCPNSCVDCLQTFRNAFYHRHLDRHVASEFLAGHGSRLEADHAIPERAPRTVEEAATSGIAVNEAERMLQRLLLAAGFPAGIRDRQLPASNKTTTPDVVYRVDEEDDALVCIYLDGLSRGIHGSGRRTGLHLPRRPEPRHPRV